MAIFIFSKNSDNKLGCLYRIASSQSVYDANKNWQDDLYDLVIVEDIDYQAVRLGTKCVLFKNGDQVTYQNSGTTYENKDSFTGYEYDKKLLMDYGIKIQEYLLKPPFNLEHSQHGIACDKLADVRESFLDDRHAF